MEALTARCAESVALLHLLHHVPVQPQSNSLNRVPPYKEGYTLSFEQERRLSGVLAFLSSIRNDPNYIPAVCLRERRKPSCLEVLIAVNKGDKDDGNNTLTELLRGFNKLFAVLSRVCEADAAHIGREALAAIVSMCSSRILNRLRFQMDPERQSAKKLLQDVLYSLRSIGESSSYPLFVDSVKDAVKLYDVYAKHQTQAELEALVEGFHRLQQLPDVESALGMIPNRLMNPNSRNSLLNIINKVGRYRKSARFLCRLARKCSLLQQMRGVTVQLGRKAFRRTPAEKLHPELASKMQQKAPNNSNPYPLERICNLLNMKVPTASQRYADQTRKTLEEGKVHAEIQLLFHCEQENTNFPPRVVCSSKDACFLCNTFILMHGKMHTPRSHGKLYPGWRLPNMGSTDIHARFVKRLDSLARGSLDTLLSRGTKTFYPDPNESTLLTLPVSATTLCSQRPHHSAAVQSSGEDSRTQPMIETAEEATAENSPLEAPKSSSDSLSNGKLSPIVEELEMTKYTGMDQVCLNNNTSPISSLPELMSNITVGDDGQTSGSGQLPETVGANGTSPFYSDGVLEIQVEYAAGATTSGGLPKQLPFSIEWLGDIDAIDRVREIDPQPIFDADSSEGELSLSLNDQRSVYITAKGSLAKLTFGRPQGG